jgi:hypothetical protein
MPWLKGSLPRPDPSISPEVYYIWNHNDTVLRAFILECVSAADTHIIDFLPTSNCMFKALHTKHEKQGTHAQINLLLKGLSVNCTFDKPICETVAEIWNYHRCIQAMRPLKHEDIFLIMLLTSLNKHFGVLQHSILSLRSMPGFNMDMVATQMEKEGALIQ